MGIFYTVENIKKYGLLMDINEVIEKEAAEARKFIDKAYEIIKEMDNRG